MQDFPIWPCQFHAQDPMPHIFIHIRRISTRDRQNKVAAAEIYCLIIFLKYILYIYVLDELMAVII